VPPRATAIAAAIAALAATAALGPQDAPASTTSGPVLVAPPTTFAGRTTTLRGLVALRDAGRTVDVQRLDSRRGWIRITSGTAAADGRFSARWRARLLGPATLRLVVRRGPAVAAGDSAATATTTVMRAARSTWYGPGLYGRRTACGFKLTRRIMGVAHRTLPCGTPVTLTLAGRTITVPVIDRGPFTKGLTYDVTTAAAKAIGMTATVTLGTLPLRGEHLDPPTAPADAGGASGGSAGGTSASG
jgi:rare lipoprotein A